MGETVRFEQRSLRSLGLAVEPCQRLGESIVGQGNSSCEDPGAEGHASVVEAGVAGAASKESGRRSGPR